MVKSSALGNTGTNGLIMKCFACMYCIRVFKILEEKSLTNPLNSDENK